MWQTLECQQALTVLLDDPQVSETDGTLLRLSVRHAKSLQAKLETMKAWKLGDHAKCPWVSQAKTTDFRSFKPPPKVTARSGSQLLSTSVWRTRMDKGTKGQQTLSMNWLTGS